MADDPPYDLLESADEWGARLRVLPPGADPLDDPHVVDRLHWRFVDARRPIEVLEVFIRAAGPDEATRGWAEHACFIRAIELRALACTYGEDSVRQAVSRLDDYLGRIDPEVPCKPTLHLMAANAKARLLMEVRDPLNAHLIYLRGEAGALLDPGSPVKKTHRCYRYGQMLQAYTSAAYTIVHHGGGHPLVDQMLQPMVTIRQQDWSPERQGPARELDVLLMARSLVEFWRGNTASAQLVSDLTELCYSIDEVFRSVAEVLLPVVLVRRGHPHKIALADCGVSPSEIFANAERCIRMLSDNQLYTDFLGAMLFTLKLILAQHYDVFHQDGQARRLLETFDLIGENVGGGAVPLHLGKQLLATLPD